MLSLRITGQGAPGSVDDSAKVPATVQARLDQLESDLKSAQAAGDAGAQAKTLNAIGKVLFHTSNFPKASDAYKAALGAARSQKDAIDEAAALNGLADCLLGQGDNQKALGLYGQALDIAAASGDAENQAAALNGSGWVENLLGDNKKALELHTQALPLARQAGDRELEAAILRRTGAVVFILGNGPKAFELVNQALLLSAQLGDADGEGTALDYLGMGYSAIGQMAKALGEFHQALPMLHDAGDRLVEAGALGNIGMVYSLEGETQKALDYDSQALTIFREVGSRPAEATELNNLGYLYGEIGEEQQALDAYNQAIPLQRAMGSRDIEGVTLGNIGDVYAGLGEPEKALEYYNQSLAILLQVGDRSAEATVVGNAGVVLANIGESAKALEFFNRALPILRQTGNRNGEGATLANIGMAYAYLGDKQKAIDSYNQALPILRETGNRNGEATTLNNIGSGYIDLGERDKAQEYLLQALPLASAVNDPATECVIYYNLMRDLKGTQPALAIFYGKQAANRIQRIRGNIRGLDKQVQADFLAATKQGFHELADLLIAQGRLPEAEEVLNLVKEQEYSDYVRGAAADTLSPLTLTPAEQQAAEDYQKSTAQLVSLGEQWGELRKIASRTPEQEKEYQDLSNRMNEASQGLNDYYRRLYVLLGNSSEANQQIADVKGNVSLLKRQIAKMPHTVALYTMVTGDGYKAIVITGATTVVREYAIPEGELNRKVAAFEEALRNPGQDAKPAAQELYKILIGPVQADLDQAKAETLVWSLDGVLRYVPMAALYDGRRYVVERYNTVTVTPVSIPNLAQKPDMSNLSAAAMGISQEYEKDLPPLPAVVGELDDVVKNPKIEAAHGVLPGTILLNGAFTEKAMEEQLSGQHTVVHIASHFVFHPGDDSQSYLLLAGKDEGGSGYHLTVADFRDNQNLAMDDTDLLTLSACETGMSGDASNGREVDGLGTTAQLKGAKAVISSLWSVNDSSTGELMADFYRRWVAGAGKVEKVEALREAQLDLLHGKVKPEGGASGRGVALVNVETPTGFTHPYYWAPFVLMGNWQ